MEEREEEQKKRLNDDLVVYMRKRSEHDAPRYTIRLKNYVDLYDRRTRGAAMRRAGGPTGGRAERKPSDTKKRPEGDQNEKNAENSRGSDRAIRIRSRSPSQQRSEVPSDGCGRRLRRKKKRRRRRRSKSCGRTRRRRRSHSCRRKRRRRRSCRRKRRSRRSRRSCRRKRSRSRRRHSCSKRRRRRRRRC